MKIQRLAWAGIKIEFDDVALFIDAHMDADYGSSNIELATTSPNRAAIVTHHHGDHCDPGALKPILGKGRIVCHREVAQWFDPHGIEVQPVELHQPVFISRISGALVARAVPAMDGFGHPQTSWVIDGCGKRIIHCGDTMWHGYWSDIGRAYGPFDAAFLPINGFLQKQGRFRDAEIPMSLTPEHAVAAAHFLNARLVVPIHYGSTADPDYFEVPDPLGNFVRLAAGRGIPTKATKSGEYLDLL